MSDHADDDSPNDIATDRSTEVQLMPVLSNDKVLGLLDADDIGRRSSPEALGPLRL